MLDREKFEKLKKSGKPIKLGDVISKERIKSAQSIESCPKTTDTLVVEIEDEDFLYLNKFHNKAKKLGKTDLSPVQIIKCEAGHRMGFTYNDGGLVKIFSDSNCCVIEKSGDCREISLFELN